MKRPLTELLAIDPDSIIESEAEDSLLPGDAKNTNGKSAGDEELLVDEKDQTLCIECGDQPTELICKDCDEWFCSVCHEYLHRTGVCKVFYSYYLITIILIHLI